MSTAVPDVRARRRAQTRREILDAAWRLAERDGVAGLSLRDLAREVGMRAPSLYTYFDSKAEIYDAMFAEGYRQLDAVMADVAIDLDDPVGTLERLGRVFLQFSNASLPRYQLLFTRVVPDWEPSPEAYAVSVANYERAAELFVRAGLPGQRPMDLWTAVLAGLAAQQQANEPGGDRWVRLIREAAEMFVEHMRRTR
jgi:AcrR family transcriptional regulator